MNQLKHIKLLSIGRGLFYAIWILVFLNFYRGNFPNSQWWKIFFVCIALLQMTWFLNSKVLIPYFLDKKEYLKYGFSFLVVAFVFVETLLFAEIQFSLKEDWIFFRERFYGNTDTHALFWYIEQLGMVTIIFMVTCLFAYVKKWAVNLLQQTQLEKEKLQAELKMLKAQVNPHFLFNTLNNIYTLAYMKDDNAAPMVEKLSSLMRYQLSEGAAKKVNLKRELSFLENYIELQSLKKSDAYNVDFYIEGIRNKHEIAPMILINFVENAFKHSDIETNPSGWISASCIVDEGNKLHFSIENSKREVAAKNGIGFGSNGAKKLLELNYPNRHELKIENQETSFKTDLRIQL